MSRTITIVFFLVFNQLALCQSNEAFIRIPGTKDYYVLTEMGRLEKLGDNQFKTIHVTFESSMYIDWIYSEKTNGQLLLKWINQYEQKRLENPTFSIDSITLFWSYNYSMISYRKEGNQYEVLSTFHSRSGQQFTEEEEAQTFNVDEQFLDGLWEQTSDFTAINGSGLVYWSDDFTACITYVPWNKFMIRNEGELTEFNIDNNLDVSYLNVLYAQDGFIYGWKSGLEKTLGKFTIQGEFIENVMELDSQDQLIYSLSGRFIVVKAHTDSSAKIDLFVHKMDGTELQHSVLDTSDVLDKFSDVFRNSNWQHSNDYILPIDAGYTVRNNFGRYILTETTIELIPNEGSGKITFTGPFEIREIDDTLISIDLLNSEGIYENIVVLSKSMIAENSAENSFSILLSLLANGVLSFEDGKYLLTQKLVRSSPVKWESQLKTVEGTVINLPQSLGNPQLVRRLLETIYRAADPDEVYEVLKYPGMFHPVIATRTHFLVMPSSDTTLYRVPKIEGEGLTLQKYLAASVDRLNKNSGNTVVSERLVEEQGVLAVDYRYEGIVLFAHDNGVSHELRPTPSELIPSKPQVLAKGMIEKNLEKINLIKKGDVTFGITPYEVLEITDTEVKQIFRYEYPVALAVSRQIVSDLAGDWKLYETKSETFQSGIYSGVIVTHPDKIAHAYWKGGNATTKRISSQDFTPLKVRTVLWNQLFERFGNDEQSDLNILEIQDQFVLTNFDKTYHWIDDDGDAEFVLLGANYDRRFNDLFRENLRSYYRLEAALSAYTTVAFSPSCALTPWTSIHFSEGDFDQLVDEKGATLRVRNFQEYKNDCAVWNAILPESKVLQGVYTISKQGNGLYTYTPEQMMYRFDQNSVTPVGIYQYEVSRTLTDEILSELEKAREWQTSDILLNMEVLESENGSKMTRNSLIYFGKKKTDVFIYEVNGVAKHVYLEPNCDLPQNPEIIKQLGTYRPVSKSFVWEIFPLENGAFAMSQDTLHQLFDNPSKTRKLGQVEVPRNYPVLRNTFFESLSKEANSNPSFELVDNFCLCGPENRYPVTATRYERVNKNYEIIALENPESSPKKLWINAVENQLNEPETKRYVESMVAIMLREKEGSESQGLHLENARNYLTLVGNSFYHWTTDRENQRNLMRLEKMNLDDLNVVDVQIYLDSMLGIAPNATFEKREYFLKETNDSLLSMLVLRADFSDVFIGIQKRTMPIYSLPTYHSAQLDTNKNISTDYWKWLLSYYPENGNAYSFHLEFENTPFLVSKSEMLSFKKSNAFEATYFKYINRVDSSHLFISRNSHLKTLVNLPIPAGEHVELFVMSNLGFVVEGSKGYYVQQTKVNGWSLNPQKMSYYAQKIKSSAVTLCTGEGLNNLEQELTTRTIKIMVEQYWIKFFSGTLLDPEAKRLKSDEEGACVDFQIAVYKVLFGQN